MSKPYTNISQLINVPTDGALGSSRVTLGAACELLLFLCTLEQVGFFLKTKAVLLLKS